MSDFEYLSESSLFSYEDGSSGNEADSEGEEMLYSIYVWARARWCS